MSALEQRVRELVPLEDYLESRLALPLDGFRTAPGITVTVGCPFHSDEQRSMEISWSTDGWSVFRCFGCGSRGDVIDAVSLGESLDHEGALGWLYQRYELGPLVDDLFPPLRPKQRRRLSDLAQRR